MGRIIMFKQCTKGKRYDGMDEALFTEMRRICKTSIECAEFLIEKRLVTYNEKAAEIVSLAKSVGFRVFKNPIKKEKEMYGIIGIDEKLVNSYGTDKIIIVDEDDEYKHQRFVLAHELGHYFWHYKKGKSLYEAYTGSKDRTNVELEANKFAAEILMPKEVFEREYNRLKEKSCRNELLSDIFEVPVDAVKNRVKEVIGIQE